MKIVRFRSKAIVFLVAFTLAIFLITRIAVINTGSTLENSADNAKELGVAKETQHQQPDGKSGPVKERRAFYDQAAKRLEPQPPNGGGGAVAVDKRSINLTAAANVADNKPPSFNGPPPRPPARPPVLVNNVNNDNVSGVVGQASGQSRAGNATVGKFVAQRRIVHLDLKGAPPQVHYFEKFFRFIKNLNATGVLIEWEDMFPYSGVLAPIRNAQAYSEQEIGTILGWAKEHRLDVIPLVQTFGHLEWILKHPQFAKYREAERYAQVICLSNPEALDLVKTAIDQVMALHKDSVEFFHMGADEAFQIGQCDKCQKAIREELGHSRDRLMLKHIANVAKHIGEKYQKRVLMWHDMLTNADVNVVKDYKLGELVEPVVWAYAESLTEYLSPDLWSKFSTNYPYVWGASAFKGADGPNRFYSNIPHYLQNHIAWTTQMNAHHSAFREFRGIILTGWQRFDHFALLCELLPVGIPSLAVNLLVVRNGDYEKNSVIKEATQMMECGTHPFDINSQGIGGFCQFPGAKVYQYVQQFKLSQKNMRAQLLEDYMLRGWMSRFNIKHNYSSAWYLDQMVDRINMYFNDLSNLAKNLRVELSKIFFPDAVEEFLYTYVNEDLEMLTELKVTALRIGNSSSFPVRPFPILNAPKPADLNVASKIVPSAAPGDNSKKVVT